MGLGPGIASVSVEVGSDPLTTWRKSGVGVLVTQSCLTLCDPLSDSPQAPLSMGFSRLENWSGLPFPPSGHLLDPGIEPMSPALQVDSDKRKGFRRHEEE